MCGFLVVKPTKQQIEDIVSQATELTWSYSIWWELVKIHNEKLAKPLAYKYPNFYMAVANSMLQGMVVIIQRLFDGRTDCLSLRGLVRKLSKNHPAVSKSLEGQIASHERLLKKCKVLRHKVYAHRDGALTPQDCFKTVAVKPNEFRELVYFVHDLVAELSELEGTRRKSEILQTLQHCDSDVGDEVRAILNDLNDIPKGEFL
jgi:hypothetical protein